MVPLTAQIEMILAASRAAWPGVSYVLQGLELREPLLLSEERLALQVCSRLAKKVGASLKLISLAAVPSNERNSWKVHAIGRVEPKSDSVSRRSNSLLLKPPSFVAGKKLPVAEYYEQLWQRGLQFGPSFRGIEKIWWCERRVSRSGTTTGSI